MFEKAEQYIHGFAKRMGESTPIQSPPLRRFQLASGGKVPNFSSPNIQNSFLSLVGNWANYFATDAPTVIVPVSIPIKNMATCPNSPFSPIRASYSDTTVNYDSINSQPQKLNNPKTVIAGKKSWEKRQCSENSEEKKTQRHLMRVCLVCKKSFSTRYFKQHISRCPKIKELFPNISADQRRELFVKAPRPEDWENNSLSNDRALSNIFSTSSSSVPVPNSEPNSEHQPEVPTNDNANNILPQMLHIFFAKSDPRFGGIPSKNEKTLACNKSNLMTLLGIAKCKTSSQLFDFKFWKDFLATEKIALSSKTSKPQVEYSTRAFRLEVLIKLFNEFKGRHDIVNAQQRESMARIEEQLLQPMLTYMNKGRGAESGMKKTKMMEENTNLKTSYMFAKYFMSEVDAQPVKPLAHLIASIYVLQNALTGVRPSGLEKMKVSEWNNRRRAKDPKYEGWAQATVHEMKNAKKIAPHVSMCPEVTKRIESYVKVRPDNSCPYLFVATRKSKHGVISSSVSELLTNKYYSTWRSKMSAQYPNLPLTFHFNNQRHNMQTEARHNPREGQPTQEIFDDFLGHSGTTGRDIYKKKLSSVNHMGAAIWTHGLLTGEPVDFQPIDLNLLKILIPIYNLLQVSLVITTR